LRDLRKAGYPFDAAIYRSIWSWRFPQMLAFDLVNASLVVRKACEGWPLLCETPLEGGNSSRFVDTSMERLEFIGNKTFANNWEIFVQGRELKLGSLPRNCFGVGLRYRRTALYPSLHPGITPHMPLYVVIRTTREDRAFKLEQDRRLFVACDAAEAPPITGRPCRKLQPELLTCDLRLA
jgi:uncharacterized protein (DUF2126 family)